MGFAQEIGPTTAFRPYFLWGIEPIVWGILVSGVFGIVVTLLTPPPNAELVSQMFDADQEPVKEAAVV
jgi:SSS family solute:Na+ symporter/sodium/pantothenate symporter